MRNREKDCTQRKKDHLEKLFWQLTGLTAVISFFWFAWDENLKSCPEADQMTSYPDTLREGQCCVLQSLHHAHQSADRLNSQRMNNLYHCNTIYRLEANNVKSQIFVRYLFSYFRTFEKSTKFKTVWKFLFALRSSIFNVFLFWGLRKYKK